MTQRMDDGNGAQQHDRDLVGSGSHRSEAARSQRMARDCVELATALRVRIAVAESLTGGLAASGLVSVPGASAVFNGAIVAYNTELKYSLLQVDARLLDDHGPVHPRVAELMARGVRDACAVGGHTVSIGLATTGVAGPDPDEASGQPAGVVYLGVSSALGTRSVGLSLSGDRLAIREQTVRILFEELYDELVAIDREVAASTGSHPIVPEPVDASDELQN
ncbi:CinA family protein [Lysinibacter cavernae]|uniref:Nicotinamide-nucleotide amidase n=1 Tax=Lysinibacter cavernae TaxID=1640652 RepID=A0A7X5QYN5_9MICO|nr:CinA family protein [Lysinibacter cavernae]NIH52202.1 nicotinamide-nucleotide amidase [Lysinibacter cavernae]